MVVSKNQPEKLAKVIQCFPKEALNSVMELVQSEMSRPDRREYGSAPSIEKRILFILQHGIHRAKFFLNLYKGVYGNTPECVFEPVDEMFSSVTGSNSLERIAYFLLCCSQDSKYFEKNISYFLASDVVDKTLNDSWEAESFVVDIQNDENSFENIKNEYEELEEEINMQVYYIGYIKKQNTFYNFYPIAKLENNKLTGLNSEELATSFPKHGGINLRTDTIYNNPSYNYISGLDGIIDSYYIDSSVKIKLFVVKFTTDILTDNSAEDIEFRLDVDEMVRNGISIDQIIFEAKELKIYRVVQPEADGYSLIEGSIDIAGDCSVGEDVLLDCGNTIYGPFTTKSNRSNEINIAPNVRLSKTPYVVDYWDEKDLQFCDTKISIFHSDLYECLALTNSEKRKQKDLVTDADILDSVADIVVNSDNDSKRFLKMLSDNPLFSVSLPKAIVERRRNRALDLFVLEENRRTILEQLVKSVTNSEIEDVFKGKVVSADDFSESQAKIDVYQKRIDTLQNDIKSRDEQISALENKNKDTNRFSVDEQVYFQPIIYTALFGDFYNRPNDINLYRTTKLMANKRYSVAFYTPDYIISYKSAGGNKVSYHILDAKFSAIKTIESKSLSDLVFKYVFSLSPVNECDTIDSLCLICGKEEMNAIEDMHDISKAFRKKSFHSAFFVACNGKDVEDNDSLVEMLKNILK